MFRLPYRLTISAVSLGVAMASFGCLSPAPAQNPAAKPARRNSANLSREFTVIPAGDNLYQQLAAIRQAGWSNATTSSSATMTRYEMALEVAKALISVRASSQADAHWAATVSPKSLRSLRALCLELKSELTRFNIDTAATLSSIDSWLRSRDASPNSSDSHASTLESSAAGYESAIAFGAANFGSARFDDLTTSANILELPLSQRLRVYGAVASLARSSYDPLLGNESGASNSTLRLGRASSYFAGGKAGAAYSISNRIQVRGEASQQRVARSLQDALGQFNASRSNVLETGGLENRSLNQNAASERTLAGGVDVALLPGVIFSGGVARVHSRVDLLTGPNDFSGTRFEGGIGLSGWQNRVALSANLSRLVPEDSAALSQTAAQLNLGVGVTQQISLKLLYQQLFETPQQPRGERIIAGGININF